MQLDYSRQQGAVDWDVISDCEICQAGIGSGHVIAENFARMGIRRLTVIDPDVVESRNITSQGFTYQDAQVRLPKVEALARECRAINPDIDIVPIQADFVAMSDAEIKSVITPKTILLLTTDYHMAQARGNLIGLVCGVPVILASLYREGRAGEIIYTYPDISKACYRCITSSRYDYVARGSGTGSGNASGSLPFAAQIVDAIVGHLTVALLHKWRGSEHNRFAKWIDALDQRSFIQTRMDPSYKLGQDDIFGTVLGHGEQVFAFDSIWQSVLAEVKPNCPDCHGFGAIGGRGRREETTEMEIRCCGCFIQKGAPHDCHLKPPLMNLGKQ